MEKEAPNANVLNRQSQAVVFPESGVWRVGFVDLRNQY